MTVYPISANFVRGELSPKLHARVDLELYGQALKDATNWLVMPQGGITRRPGTIFIGPAPTESKAARLVEFEFNEEQAYAMLFNDTSIWFYTLGAQVVQTSQAITGITKANPAVITYSGSDTFANGDRVRVSGIVGMTEMNNRIVTVANVNTGSNTFEASGINSTGFTTYSSGGILEEVVSVTHSYAEADLFEMQFAQAADVVYIAHVDYAPATLERASNTSWALAAFAPEDGPWLDEDEQGVYMTPAATGGLVPDMTNNTTPSGTAADSSSSANAWKAFDRDTGTYLEISATAGWISYDFASTAEYVCDAYWLAADTVYPGRTPANWTFEGQDSGGTWHILDVRVNETTWAPGERRYYEFPNETVYRTYRLVWTSVDGDRQKSRIAELVLHEHGDYQTAFNLTASATTGINGGSGFVTADAGRNIRLMGADGVWRWARIVARSSSTVVTIRLYHHALLDLSRLGRWQLSAWSDHDGYPAAVGFYQDRLGWARTDTSPRTNWFSEPAWYVGFGVSDPPEDNDAIYATMNGGRLSAITWIEDLGDLVVGTGADAAPIQPLPIDGGLSVIGPSATAEPFSSTNIRARSQAANALLYVDRYRKRLYELSYSGEGGGLVSREISIASDHLFESGVIECAFQQDRYNLGLFVMDDGTVTAVTYDPAQGVAGFTPVEIAGTAAEIESVASIPSAGGAVVYMVVKRTINGATRRYVEYMAPRYETGDTLADAVYFDCAFRTTVSGATSITGITWLIGETIGLLINGVDVGDAVVSAAGTVTLPSTTTGTVVGGLRFTSRAETLRAPTSGNKDGTGMGRPMKIHNVSVDMLNAKGLRAGTLTGTRAVPHPEREAAAGVLNTGIFPVQVDDSGKNEGVIVLSTDKGYPATVRALVGALEGAP